MTLPIKNIDKILNTSFSKLLVLYIRSSLTLKGGSKHVISHKGSTFIWTNGDDTFFPLLEIPLYVEEDPLYFYSKSPNLNHILEYLSLLSVRCGIPIDLDYRHIMSYICVKEAVGQVRPTLKRNSYLYPDLPREIDMPIYDTTCNLSPKEEVIVGLFRDGISNANPFHSFLSFYKILERTFGRSKNAMTKRQQWINDQAEFKKVKMFAIETNQLGALGTFDKLIEFSNHSRYKGDLASYFYCCCRCAIAHVDKNPLRRPSDFSDCYEIGFATEVIKFMARYLILERFDDSKLIPTF